MGMYSEFFHDDSLWGSQPRSADEIRADLNARAERSGARARAARFSEARAEGLRSLEGAEVRRIEMYSIQELATAEGLTVLMAIDRNGCEVHSRGCGGSRWLPAGCSASAYEYAERTGLNEARVRSLFEEAAARAADPYHGMSRRERRAAELCAQPAAKSAGSAAATDSPPRFGSLADALAAARGRT